MPTRRDILKSACGLAALVVGLAKVGGRVNVGTVKGVPVAVVRTGRTSYASLDLRCTHQGVTVGSSASGWACPAHGSRYAENGSVTNGPTA